MASTEQPKPAKAAEPGSGERAEQTAAPRPTLAFLFQVDLALRILVFSATAAAVAVMAAGKQTLVIYFPGVPIPLVNDAKFSYSPALM